METCNARVHFKLGSMYTITIALLCSDEDTDKTLIEQAMDVILGDIGVDIRRICYDINRNPYQSDVVSLERNDRDKEEYKTIHCKGCNGSIRVLKRKNKKFCISCLEERV